MTSTADGQSNGADGLPDSDDGQQPNTTVHESDTIVEEKIVSFYKGNASATELRGLGQGQTSLELVRKDVADAMDSKNLAFLLGSGCSSARDASGRELGIPTMGPMAQQFIDEEVAAGKIPAADKATLLNILGVDLEAPRFALNLEELMEVLFGFQFVIAMSNREELRSARGAVDRTIDAVKRYIFEACSAGQSSRTVLTTYERFYRRLAQRDRALPRPWVFTTNYDLFNETAMDRLGIPYINGFQGSIERRFNPASFRYTIAEQLDIRSRKWSSLEGLVYFAKLHGSLSWLSVDEGLFPVTESMPVGGEPKLDRMLIYPTPAKQNASFAAPYSDMFRELQTRVAREQSALITLGYSFSDEHVNNIIFQALTIPTFRLVALVDPGANEKIRTLRDLDDPRVWIIGTEDRSASWKGHYFANFVDEIMPTSGDDPANEAVERVLKQLINHIPNTRDTEDE